MKKGLYLVHCGFYDSTVCDGIYESHVNFFVVASSFDEARLNAKENCDFKAKKMHIDGMQEIVAIGGLRIELIEDPSLPEKTIIVSHRHRDLASKSSFMKDVAK